jgi:hypothetical protein
MMILAELLGTTIAWLTGPRENALRALDWR